MILHMSTYLEEVLIVQHWNSTTVLQRLTVTESLYLLDIDILTEVTRLDY